ncbi:MAG: bifunctional (p)ppGpp synthetase/guanosine-3',5'-bis(diphosphate) 3'-pyrophosphohydrolase, partial [Bacteroidetes bacterium]
RARDMIELALRRERRQTIEKGIEILRRGAKALNLDIDDNHPYTRELAAYTNMDSVDTFLYALATGMITFSTIRSFIEHKKQGKVIDILPEEEEAPGQKMPLRGKILNPEMLILAQEGDYRTYVLAPCCTPIPGDEILGLRHKANKKRVTIHRNGCNRATALMAQFGDSIVKAAWSGAHPEVEFLIGIKIVGRDRKGMLNDLIRLISMRQSLNIRRVSIESQGAKFEGHFDVYVHGVDELNELLEQLSKVSHVDGSFRYIAGNPTS